MSFDDVPVRQRVRFKGGSGFELSGVLQQAKNQTALAIFCHPFTSSKDLRSMVRISDGLAQQGVSVLRFDFTGLGASEGRFADTTFASNIDDLVAAHRFLEGRLGRSADLLFGLSLGGTVSVAAAAMLKPQRVITINAPTQPRLVLRHFTDVLPRIEREGELDVIVVGRRVTLSKKLVDSMQKADALSGIDRSGSQFLVLHATEDDTADFTFAEDLFAALPEPKRLVALEGADHLLTRQDDCQLALKTIQDWLKK